MIIKQEQEAELQPIPVSLQAVSTRTVEEIVRDLASRDKAVRTAAESELGSLGPTATEPLLHALEEEGLKYRKQRRARKRFTAVALTFVGLYLVIGISAGISTGQWDMLSQLGSMAGLFGGIGAVAAMSPQHKSIVSLMANLDDARSIGWLADSLNSDDVTVRSSASKALIRLLPRLTPANASLLDDESRRSLDRTVVKSDDSGLVLAILNAFEVVGDGRSLEAVAAVEQERAVTKQPAIVEAAMRAGDAIRARIEKEHQAHVLLRAIDAGDQADTLLRPAEDAGSNDPTNLLRASDAVE